MWLSSQAKFRAGACAALGLGTNIIFQVVLDDLAYQAQTAPRPFPTYNAGNHLGYGLPRDFRDYGAPYWGGVGSNISPPLSDEEFRSHFFFGSDVFSRALASLSLPADPARVALGLPPFPYRFEGGISTRWLTQETAFLVFCKRLSTRAATAFQLQFFFGRSSGWISEVSNAAFTFLLAKWIPLKTHNADTRVHHEHRLHDYARLLRDKGLHLPFVVGFVDGIFHCINGAFGLVTSRHHDAYLARVSALVALLTTGALAG